MTRRTFFVLPLVLASCGKVAELPASLFPESAAGGWRRASVRELPVSESPDPVPRNEVERLREAAYEGPGKLQARVYQFGSETLGADLMQRWHPSADTVFFSVGRYFVVVKWQAADRKALQEFLGGLETRLSAAQPRK